MDVWIEKRKEREYLKNLLINLLNLNCSSQIRFHHFQQIHIIKRHQVLLNKYLIFQANIDQLIVIRFLMLAYQKTNFNLL